MLIVDVRMRAKRKLLTLYHLCTHRNFYAGNGSRYAYITGSNETSHQMDKIVVSF